MSCETENKVMKTKHAKGGFTLIELLVVFLVIMLLAGMTFRLMNAEAKAKNVAVTKSKVEQVAHALEEFKAIYGQYPPVAMYPSGDGYYQPFEYEYAVHDARTISAAGVGGITREMADEIRNYDGAGDNQGTDDGYWDGGGDKDKPHGFVLYTFGLMSYLFPRYYSHASQSPGRFVGSPQVGNAEDDGVTYKRENAVRQWHNGNNRQKMSMSISDFNRDLEASRRILPFLGARMLDEPRLTDHQYGYKYMEIISGANNNEDYGIVDKGDSGWHAMPGASSGGGSSGAGMRKYYINERLTIHDAWGKSLNYSSKPPYDSFRVWSSGGPNGDIVVGHE